MNVVCLGATKGMGRALARAMAERGDALFLLGRDDDDLKRSARDLEVRGAQGTVHTAYCDLGDSETFSAALVDAERALGTVDTVVVTAGQFAPQDDLEEDAPRLREMLAVNFTNTVLFCERARKTALKSGGTLCVFSSVAGERGRTPVVLYGASKAGLTRYLEGLDHRYRRAGLRVVTVKPGFVRTSMTDGLPAPPFAGEPDQVARIVLRAIDRGTPVVYAPGPWRHIMAIVRALPRSFMRRASF